MRGTPLLYLRSSGGHSVSPTFTGYVGLFIGLDRTTSILSTLNKVVP